MTGNAASGMSGDISQLLLGITAGILLAMAGTMLRAPRAAARWTGFAFFFCSALFAIKLWNDQVLAMPPELAVAVGVTAMTSVGWFWLMVMALFGDVDRYRPIMFAAPLAMLLCGIANFIRIAPFIQIMWVVTTALQVTLAIWSIVIVLRSWKDDLVESRRRLRGPFMVAVALYILSLNGFDILQDGSSAELTVNGTPWKAWIYRISGTGGPIIQHLLLTPPDATIRGVVAEDFNESYHLTGLPDSCRIHHLWFIRDFDGFNQATLLEAARSFLRATHAPGVVDVLLFS